MLPQQQLVVIITLTQAMSFTATELRRRAVGYAFPELHVRTYIGVLPTEKRPELSPDFARAKQYQSLVYLVCLLLTYGCIIYGYGHVMYKKRYKQQPREKFLRKFIARKKQAHISV